MKYEKDSFLPIVLGSQDRALLKKLLKKYGAPVFVLDSSFPLSVRLSPSFNCVRMTAQSEEIVMMYLFDIAAKQMRIPLLAADERYMNIIERNKEKLSASFIINREEMGF
jgi:hypothetical protein